jgi:hypothetical protein
LCAVLLMPALPAAAQNEAATGADQVVGLFGATCLTYADDVASLREYLDNQHAPRMTPQDRDKFLTGRPGVVYDTSFQTTKLALVSLDDGGCEAVAATADARQVIVELNQAARANNVVLTPERGQGAPKARPGVTQTAFALTLAGRPMHIVVSTEAPAPQAVLTLVPR